MKLSVAVLIIHPKIKHNLTLLCSGVGLISHLWLTLSQHQEQLKGQHQGQLQRQHSEQHQGQYQEQHQGQHQDQGQYK